MPLKFSLGGDYGLDVVDVGSPASGALDCESLDPGETLTPTEAAGGTALTYDPASGQYTYVWKTEKAWAGTCRYLSLQLVGRHGASGRVPVQVKGSIEMKVSSRSLLAVVVTLVAVLALLSGASAQPEVASRSGPGRPGLVGPGQGRCAQRPAEPGRVQPDGGRVSRTSTSCSSAARAKCLTRSPTIPGRTPTWPCRSIRAPAYRRRRVNWLWQLGEQGGGRLRRARRRPACATSVTRPP